MRERERERGRERDKEREREREGEVHNMYEVSITTEKESPFVYVVACVTIFVYVTDDG